MSLDIRFTTRENIVCPKSGEIVAYNVVDCAVSGGRGWYPILEEIGYYVPAERRIEENDWYGKDMVLSAETSNKVYAYIKTTSDLYNGSVILNLIARAMKDGNNVVVSADW